MRTWIPQSLNSKSCLCKQNKYEGSIVHVPTQSSQWNSVHLKALQSVLAAPLTTSASLGTVREGITLQVTAICSITNQRLQLPTLPLKGPPLSPYSMPLSMCTPFSRFLWALSPMLRGPYGHFYLHMNPPYPLWAKNVPGGIASMCLMLTPGLFFPLLWVFVLKKQDKDPCSPFH